MKKDNIDKFVEKVNAELLVLGGDAGSGALVGLWAVAAVNLSSALNRGFETRILNLLHDYEVKIKSIRYDVSTDECFYTLEYSGEVREVKML